MKQASNEGRRDVVVVGAGQAGLSVSWYLRLFGVDHVVLEKGGIGESWRSSRWDSFTLVTPAWMTRLPGLVQPPGVGPEFTPRLHVIAMLEAFGQPLPVRAGVEVTSVSPDETGYRLATSDGWVTANVVVATSGAQSLGVVPAMAARLPATVLQLHAGEYRNPFALPAGAVLVVGSGQSGAQIAEELVRAGRQVYLATSRVGRVPRRYRGRDAHDWAQEMGVDDRLVEDASPEELAAAHPLLSGAHGGHTVALQQLARDGVALLGRLSDIDSTRLRFADDLGEHLRFADQAAATFRSSVDQHIARHHLAARPPDTDPAEWAYSFPGPSLREIDLHAAGIRTVIWCVGFRPDTAWIDLPILDATGHVVNDGGATARPGFYTVGAPWLTHRGSGILYGVASDASRIARRITAFLAGGRRCLPVPADRPLVSRPLAS